MLLLTYFLSFVFDVLFVSNIHEFGHYSIGSILGAEVISSSWGMVEFGFLNPIQSLIIGFSGGLFAVTYVVIVFGFSSHIISGINPQTEKGYNQKSYFESLIKSILLTVISIQLFASFFEGLNLPLYREITANPFTIGFLMLSFSFISNIYFFKNNSF